MSPAGAAADGTLDSFCFPAAASVPFPSTAANGGTKSKNCSLPYAPSAADSSASSPRPENSASPNRNFNMPKPSDCRGSKRHVHPLHCMRLAGIIVAGTNACEF